MKVSIRVTSELWRNQSLQRWDITKFILFSKKYIIVDVSLVYKFIVKYMLEINSLKFAYLHFINAKKTIKTHKVIK